MLGVSATAHREFARDIADTHKSLQKSWGTLEMFDVSYLKFLVENLNSAALKSNEQLSKSLLPLEKLNVKLCPESLLSLTSKSYLFTLFNSFFSKQFLASPAKFGEASLTSLFWAPILSSFFTNFGADLGVILVDQPFIHFQGKQTWEKRPAINFSFELDDNSMDFGTLGKIHSPSAFLVEIAKEKAASDISYKDFSKLLLLMRGSVQRQLLAFDNDFEVLNDVGCYGAFVSEYTITLHFMKAVADEDGVVMFICDKIDDFVFDDRSISRLYSLQSDLSAVLALVSNLKKKIRSHVKPTKSVSVPSSLAFIPASSSTHGSTTPSKPSSNIKPGKKEAKSADTKTKTQVLEMMLATQAHCGSKLVFNCPDDWLDPDYKKRTAISLVVWDSKPACALLKRHVTAEIDILKRLRHSTIVKMFDSLEINGFSVLILERLCYLNSIDTIGAKKKAMDILNGLSFLHENRIIHRDVKPTVTFDCK
jgi:hypothetical protein